MNTALQHTAEHRSVNFSRDQVQLLKDTVCRGATDDELRLFLEVCRSKRLDPFGKQIHAVKRWDSGLRREVMSFQIGIDGFRALAERSGRYVGQDAPVWCGLDGEWHDVWLAQQPPVAAKMSVHKEGFVKPVTRIALFREYVQTTKDGGPNSMWTKMPANQLAKCAEALAFRAAFPEELSGLYTPDEMGQSENDSRRVKQPLPIRSKPTPSAPTPVAVPEAVIDVEPIEPPQPESEDAGEFRVPSEEELRNGLRKGLETLPALTAAWRELQIEYDRAGVRDVIERIQQRYERDPSGNRTPLSLRTAVIVARNWKDDHLDLWLRQPGEEG
jgi:phage recombination protein Bet